MTASDFDGMISLIYDASLNPEGWEPFLSAFHLKLHAYLTVIVFRHRPLGSLVLLTRAEEEGDQAFRQSYARVETANPIDYEGMETGRIYSLQEFLPNGDLWASRFFTDHLQPAGKSHLELVAIGPAEGFRAHFLWVRDDAMGPLDADERAWMQRLIPHLERGMAIFGQSKLLRLASGISTEALDQLAFGAIALDKDGRVLFCNRVAEALIAKSEDLSQQKGRLIFRRREHAQTMRQLSLSIDPDAQEKEVVLRLRNGDEMLGMLARSITPLALDKSFTTARVIIYLHALTHEVRPSAALLSKLFGLAPSEAALAILLSEGTTLREAAEQLGITENSARTYSKRIFVKTGVRRQADLVRLILSSVAMLGL
ncbi:helix-turn-helix transcriptional regulator [Novosphingobium sp. G106]|uniref:helix-turn-helix transcriptional regulator n=1 Tax=Novosphingobium sp. G106 TaxID=2849500 RepID=UPI001C2DE5EC|nr:helix-turn-helix transcriptional regulator [Novosphingobium sp. G106]MBV1688913.1 helix-turn-helix transcriptional regulator [Novosphingobium sp. G106]